MGFALDPEKKEITEVSIAAPPPHFLGGVWDDSKIAKERFKRMADSPWKVVDVETTGRTPFSAPLKTKEKNMGRLRCRIISAAWMNDDGTLESAAWDLDTMTKSEQGLLAKSCLTNTFIAHNAAFDLGWLLHLARKCGISTEKLWPKNVLCTLHLGRQLFPENRLELRRACTDFTDRRRSWVYNRLKADRAKENWGASLEDFTMALNLPWELDKSYQKPNNWVHQAPLSPGHYKYVQDDAFVPIVVIHRLLTEKSLPKDNEENQETLIKKAAAFITEYVNNQFEKDERLDFYKKISMPAIQHLVNISAKGMPWDHRGAQYYRNQQMDKLNIAVDTINKDNYPHLEPFKDLLREPNEGLTQNLQDAWVKTFQDYEPDISIPKTGAGQYSLSGKDLKRVKLDKSRATPVFKLLTTIQKGKQAIKMIDNLEQFALRGVLVNGGDPSIDLSDRDKSRLHPLLGFGPGTDRLSSNDPNAQNFPRDPNFRALVRAKPGYKIISADYGQIELRIAAGLALRAQAQINEMLANKDHKEATPLGERTCEIIRKIWGQEDMVKLQSLEKLMLVQESAWNEVLRSKMREFSSITKEYKSIKDIGPDGKPVPDDYQAIKDERDICRLTLHACRVRLNQMKYNENITGALATAFREGIDPHLFTGLKMAQATGLDIGGDDVLTVVRAAKKDGKVDELKQKFKQQRTNAKAVNFGLLYGMTPETLHITGITNYGLDWAVDEAITAHDAWFSLYPEIGLWQYWTILRPEWQGPAMVCKVNMKTSVADVKKKEIRSWRSTSLYGRPYVREGFREALNYPDQGTGAHMILRAMSLMSKKVRSYLIDQIHDEILVEAPEEEAEATKLAIEKAMITSGNEALAQFNIPVEVDAELGDVWLHGDTPDEIPDDFEVDDNFEGIDFYYE
jgi:DNA polymerase-1